MKRLVRCYRIPLWVMVLLLVACSIAFSGWADERKERESEAVSHGDEIKRLEKNADRLASMAAGSQAAVAIVMQGRQYEAAKAGEMEAKGQSLSSQLESAKGQQRSWKGAAYAWRHEGCRLESILRDNGYRITSQQLACHKLPKE